MALAQRGEDAAGDRHQAQHAHGAQQALEQLGAGGLGARMGLADAARLLADGATVVSLDVAGEPVAGAQFIHCDVADPASAAIVQYTWGKLWNSKAYAACSNMPRFGHMKLLNQDQLRHVMALLLDPKSPVNQ